MQLFFPSALHNQPLPLHHKAPYPQVKCFCRFPFQLTCYNQGHVESHTQPHTFKTQLCSLGSAVHWQDLVCMFVLVLELFQRGEDFFCILVCEISSKVSTDWCFFLVYRKTRHLKTMQILLCCYTVVTVTKYMLTLVIQLFKKTARVILLVLALQVWQWDYGDVKSLCVTSQVMPRAVYTWKQQYKRKAVHSRLGFNS